MLDIALRNVSFTYPKGRFTLRVNDLLFAKSTHTAIAGPPGCGASTLLKLIAGELRPDSGDVIAGARVLNAIKPARRPFLVVSSALDVPQRWSVQHALIAAVRTRTLDRIDRHHEYELAISKWGLGDALERRVGTLSTSEQMQLHLARIELLKPGVLIADRLLANANSATRDALADELYRTLRVMGATVISAPSSRDELALTDQIVVLDGGNVVQSGSAADVFANPVNEAAALATGAVNAVPVTIRGSLVASPIGEWEVEEPSFEGDGVALARPDDFAVAVAGEESDFVFSIEEAGFHEGRWLARGFLSGSLSLRVALPRGTNVHKGRLLPLRYDPKRFRLLPR
ncbi:MAG TPA: ATP-binding cassette domain-containing protein [Thermoanaerobaculia bacterium]|nr:ATP-binding cassette domain-containing protein [Thermoanaerobaculia bacterium]